MKKYISIIVLFFFSGLISAQTAPDTTWTQMYSGGLYDWAWGVLETSDGGYIMVGDTESAGAGDWDIGIIKTDEFGVTEWTQTYGGLYEDRGQCIQHTTDGGYIILGTTGSYGEGSYDIWLVKIDNAGNESWTKTFGGTSCDWGYYVEQTADDGYIITGAFDPGTYWIHDLILIKTDSEGNAEWTKTFGEEDNADVGHCVKQTSEGGYIITGYTYTNSAGSSDVWLIKTDENGISEWDNTFGDTEPEHGYSVIQSGDEYIITGYTKSYGEGDYDIWILKTDNTGNEIWNKTYGGTEDDRSFDIKPTSDNNFVIAGYTDSFGAGDYDMWLLKIDNAGDTLWTKTIGDYRLNRARSVVQTSDSGYILAGDTYAGLDNGEYNYYLVKIDSDQGEQPPVITVEPTNQSICEGDNAIFGITATGADSYRWQENTGSGFENITNGGIYSGAETYTLTITGASLDMTDNQYQCVVTNTYGNVTSNVALLTVSVSVSITSQPESLEIQEGNDAVFTVIATGDITSYQWRKNETELSDIDNISGSTTNELTISTVSQDDAGNYDCVITGECNEITSNLVSLSILTNIKNIQSTNIKIYPNPTTGIFTINFAKVSNFGKVKAEITNISGQIIKQYSTCLPTGKIINYKLEVDLSEQSKGIYFVKIQTDEIYYTEKIILIK